MVNLILHEDLHKITTLWNNPIITKKEWVKILKNDTYKKRLFANYIYLRGKSKICVLNNPDIWLEVYSCWSREQKK